MKRCTRCKAEKPTAAFSKASRSPDGLHWWCKPCFAEHYARTRAETLARNRAWREANPDYFRRIYAANRDAYNAKSKAYNAVHQAEARERMRRYRQENRELIRSLNRAAYARKVGAPVVERIDRFEVFDRGGGICGVCQSPVDRQTFHVDHIVPLALGGEHTYRNTQPAHPVCNLRKGVRLAAA